MGTTVGDGRSATIRADAVGRLIRASGPDRSRAMEAVTVVPSRPGTVVRGTVPNRRDPVVTVRSGAALRVDTVSHQGINQVEPPTEFFGAFGVPPEDVLADVVAIHATVPREPGASGHVLTGPIAVDGARPGDVLEVRMLGAEPRVPYGINRSRPDSGLIPGFPADPHTCLLTLGADGRLSLGSGVAVPCDPFPGIVAVAPPDEAVSTKLPGPWGGNLDLRILTTGASLYLPVFVPDAQLYLGDPHTAQGDGEVNGTGVEHSVTFTVEVTLHPAVALTWPVVATPTHLAATAVGPTLEEALRGCVEATIGLAVGFSGGELSQEDAYALASIATDFRIATAVNRHAVVYGLLPRDVFGPERSGAPW